MRRALAVIALAAIVALLHAPEVRAGAGQAGENVATGKLSGPAVSATVVIKVGPGTLPPADRLTTLRVSKGSLESGALFPHSDPVDWSLGCDGAGQGFNLATLTDERFVGIRLRSWVPSSVLSALFTQIGVALNESTRIPVITDVDNVACTSAGGEFFVSFTAIIQLENSLQ